MESKEHQIVESLSGNDDRIIHHLPYLLQDLFFLGSNQEVLIQLIDRNLDKLVKVRNVLELCCGKGASLISIVKKYNWFGKGIDLFQPFILEARSTAIKENILQNIDFEVMDIQDATKNLSNYDLVLCGSDTRCLGNEIETLQKISRCLNQNGYIIYETAYVKNKAFEKLLKGNGFDVIDKIEHDRTEVEKINRFNTNKIRMRANELIEKYPEQNQLFNEYVKLQEEECKELEDKFLFITFLLNCKKTV